MKKKKEYYVDVYVGSSLGRTWEDEVCCVHPEECLMPLDAVKETKRFIDGNIGRSTAVMPIGVYTGMPEVVSFVSSYAERKGYKVRYFYRGNGRTDRRIGVEALFAKLNRVFRYIDKVTDTER